jgi:hypothetical protein
MRVGWAKSRLHGLATWETVWRDSTLRLPARWRRTDSRTQAPHD